MAAFTKYSSSGDFRMSFSRISLVALALAAGLAAPASAATVSGTLELTVTSTAGGAVTGDLREVPVISQSGTGAASTSDNFSVELDVSGVALSETPVVLSEDGFSATTGPGVGIAQFGIARSFTFQGLSDGFISFGGTATLTLQSLGVFELLQFSAFLDLVEATQGEIAIEPEDDTNFPLDVSINGATNQAPVFPLSLATFSVREDAVYIARLQISGFAQTFAKGGVDPEPEDPPVIPLPATAALLPLGLVALGALRRRKKG